MDYALSGPGCALGDAGTCAVPTGITRPNGTSYALNWDVVEKCSGYDSELNCIGGTAYFRFDGVTSSTHYSFSFNFATDSPGNFSAPQSNWYKRTGATFTNSLVTPSPLPSVTYSAVSTGVEDITDTGGRTWRITSSGNLITGIRRPGSTSDDIAVSYGTGGIVSSITRDGVTTGYARSVSGTTATTTITNALSQQTVVTADLSKERVTSVKDALNRTTGLTYDSNSRLTRTTAPEGNYVQLTYDARGNVTETRNVAKSGTGLSDIVASAAYPSTCANVKTCNKPTTTTDARGKTTDYAWDTTYGGVTSVTAPAATTGAVRPEVRYTYTLVNGGYQVTGVSACQTTSSCSGGADEVKSILAYDGNGNVTSTTARNGSGTLIATATATYDAIGNRLTVDGPLSGTADTTRFRYNASREVVGTIGPDPDGGGALKHRAQRTTYRTNGQVEKVERGTVNSQSDSDWAAFASLEQAETGFDANDRPVTRKATAGGTTYGLVQTSYDALGRPECTAQRMNSAAFGSLPSSACSLGTQGSFGPDRIVKTVYDAAGQVVETRSAVGTALEAADVTATFRANGQAETVTDAEDNKTTYEYDGHDRLVKTRYPVATKGLATSSTTDYEQYGYDAGGNLTSLRNRAGESIAFTFDNLSRMTLKDLPGTEPDVSYAYDLLGRITSATQSGNSLSFGWDALGRMTTQGGSHGTYTSAYDLAGRRTRLTHPGGFYVDHDYLVTGEVTKIRENGATSGIGVLATYTYNSAVNAGQLGQVTSIAFGNGTVRSFGYDAVSRLATLGQDLAGTSADQSLGFTYNPASEIATNTRSNDLYAWSGHYNVNRGYTANGLNQYTATGSIVPTYDAKGNLTSAGATTYAYSSENLLKSATGGITLGYDPAMRPYQVAGGSAGTTRFGYDGVALRRTFLFGLGGVG